MNSETDASIQSVLGFDFGLRRIGVAMAQTITGTASPLTTLLVIDGNPRWEEVDTLVNEWEPHAFVIGQPTHREGSEKSHEMMEHINRFCQSLKQRYGLPIYLVDEYLSSYAAEAQLPAKLGRKKNDKKHLDSYAAKVILETWLSQRQ